MFCIWIIWEEESVQCSVEYGDKFTLLANTFGGSKIIQAETQKIVIEMSEKSNYRD